MSVGILPNVNPIKNESGCKAGDKCLFPHHKVDEQQNKKPKKCDHSHPKKESDDKHAVATVIVSRTGCLSQDSELSDSQRGKQARSNPMQKVFGPIRRIRFTQSTLRQGSIREKKGPSLGKNKSKILTCEVPAL